MVIRILEHFKIQQYFLAIVGSELDGRRSAKKEVIKEAMEQLQIDEKNKIVMVGDRKFDVEGAKENGIQSIGVSYGYATAMELENAGAEYIVSSIQELENIITS